MISAGSRCRLTILNWVMHRTLTAWELTCQHHEVLNQTND